MHNELEPQWLPYKQYDSQDIGSRLVDWLLEEGSLTQRLKVNSQHFCVEIVSLHWAKPFISERKSLKMKANHLAYIREVILRCNNEAWVFARTVIPRTSLAGKNNQLSQLGVKPLGQLLFEQPNIQRGPFELAAINSHHYHHQKIASRAESLWGRRSVFYLENKPLLISEIFLEAFPFQ